MSEKKKIAKVTNINIAVGLDDENVPQQIKWSAEDNPEGNTEQESKAMLLSIFDRESLDTLKIDLWTKEMQVNEMDRFFYQTLRAMADTYHRATKNDELAGDMQKFVQYFVEQTEILKK